MAPRDDRDRETRRKQIIDGALHVFAAKGFERATNRDIALAARINSPGLIYHYFKDKADLFTQVVEENAPALAMIARGSEFMDLPPREVLTRLGEAFVLTFENRTARSMFRMMLGEAARRPAVAQLFNKVGPGRGLAFLTRYFAHQMELGNLRKMDPSMAARSFAGPLIAYMLTAEFFPQPDAASLDPRVMVQGAVEIFLNGILEAE